MNTTLSATDARCQYWAETARMHARSIGRNNALPDDWDFLAGIADNIIEARTRELTAQDGAL